MLCFYYTTDFAQLNLRLYFQFLTISTAQQNAFGAPKVNRFTRKVGTLPLLSQVRQNVPNALQN